MSLNSLRTELADRGYCVIPDVLSPERLARLRNQLQVIAEYEASTEGGYFYNKGTCQRIWNLLNKGEEFQELVQEDAVLRLVSSIIDPYFLLSNIDANIIGPGATPMRLHADQGWMPLPWPSYALTANAIWMLDDFTPENGATRLVPGTHIRGGPPDSVDDPEPICGRAGSVLIFDGRLWHQTGANWTPTPRRAVLCYYCRAFIRQQENFFVSLAPHVLAGASPVLRRLLGWDIYMSLGMINGMPAGGPEWVMPTPVVTSEEARRD